jgi:hypothetical protein
MEYEKEKEKHPGRPTGRSGPDQTIRQLYRQRYAFLKVLCAIEVIRVQRYCKNRCGTIALLKMTNERNSIIIQPVFYRITGSTSILRVEMNGADPPPIGWMAMR